VLVALHNTPFGDIVDSEDDLQPLVFSMTADALRALDLFTDVLTGCKFNTRRMAERAHSDFLTVTELADTLVRGEDLSFRQSHRLVSEAVRQLQGQYSEQAMVETVLALAPTHLGRPLRMSHADLERSLDPVRFVMVRGIPGGPAPEAVRVAMADVESDVDSSDVWIAEKSGLLEGYRALIRDARRDLA
jgi:argininosuccinate lyase